MLHKTAVSSHRYTFHHSVKKSVKILKILHLKIEEKMQFNEGKKKLFFQEAAEMEEKNALWPRFSDRNERAKIFSCTEVSNNSKNWALKKEGKPGGPTDRSTGRVCNRSRPGVKQRPRFWPRAYFPRVLWGNNYTMVQKKNQIKNYYF